MLIFTASLLPQFEFLVDELCERAEKKDKCLVFCHWTTEMKLLQQELKKRDVSALIFDGGLSRDAKDSVLYNFRHSTIPVLILQIVCGSTGLNLQVANRIYITSVHWNPCVELQAIGRAYRKGQLAKVVCTRVLMTGTIEEKCMQIQEAKLGVIAEAMDDDTLSEHLYGAGGGGADDKLLGDEIDRIFASID
jgi:SNF2 family DNA or RNA helicase